MPSVPMALGDVSGLSEAHDATANGILAGESSSSESDDSDSGEQPALVRSQCQFVHDLLVNVAILEFRRGTQGIRDGA